MPYIFLWRRTVSRLWSLRRHIDWGLRDYGTATWTGGDAACDHKQGRQTSRTNSDKQSTNTAGNVATWQECGKCGAARVDLGLEATPDEYVANMVAVFREVWRVLRDDGTCWINLGDSYASQGGSKAPGQYHHNTGQGQNRQPAGQPARSGVEGIKPKDLVGIPWRVAFALQADGWWLRSEITWCKVNPMPESVTDRCTSATEKIFMLAKSPRYYFDAEAIKEPAAEPERERNDRIGGSNGHTVRHSEGGMMQASATRNRRNWWPIATDPYPGSHFATFPRKLVEPCILAGTSAMGACPTCGAGWVRVVEREDRITDGRREQRDYPGAPQRSGKVPGSNTRGYPTYSDTTTGWAPACACPPAEPVPQLVLDPFAGSGTTGKVAIAHRRRFVGLDLNPAYIEMARGRTAEVQINMLVGG